MGCFSEALTMNLPQHRQTGHYSAAISKRFTSKGLVEIAPWALDASCEGFSHFPLTTDCQGTLLTDCRMDNNDYPWLLLTDHLPSPPSTDDD